MKLIYTDSGLSLNLLQKLTSKIKYLDVRFLSYDVNFFKEPMLICKFTTLVIK